MEPNKLENLIKDIEELKREINSMKSGSQLDPDQLSAIVKNTTATPSSGYDGRFLVKGKYIDYIDP